MQNQTIQRLNDLAASYYAGTKFNFDALKSATQNADVEAVIEELVDPVSDSCTATYAFTPVEGGGPEAKADFYNSAVFGTRLTDSQIVAFALDQLGQIQAFGIEEGIDIEKTLGVAIDLWKISDHSLKKEVAPGLWISDSGGAGLPYFAHSNDGEFFLFETAREFVERFGDALE